MAEDIKSPCNSSCKLYGDICKSCGRTRVEIKAWKGLKHPRKKAVIRDAALRLKKLSKNAP
jgi:predicted Fe-S protein YdhL (DUF1289 family)